MPPLWPLLLLLALAAGYAGGEAARHPGAWRPAPRVLWRLPPGEPIRPAAPVLIPQASNEAAKINTPPPEAADAEATPKATRIIPDPIPEEEEVAGPGPWVKHSDRFDDSLKSALPQQPEQIDENVDAMIPAMPIADPDQSEAVNVDLKVNAAPFPEEEAVAAPCDFCVPGAVYAFPMPMAPRPARKAERGGRASVQRPATAAPGADDAVRCRRMTAAAALDVLDAPALAALRRACPTR